MSKSVEMIGTPYGCNFCESEGATEIKNAQYDAKTRFGPWAYMCEQHWQEHGLGKLGTGFGQELIWKEEKDAEHQVR